MSNGWIPLPLSELMFALDLANSSCRVGGQPADPFDGFQLVEVLNLDELSDAISRRFYWEYDQLLAA